MTEPDPGIDVPADHNLSDGPQLGWDKGDFGPDDYVGDEETRDYPLVADGTQTDGADGA